MEGVRAPDCPVFAASFSLPVVFGFDGQPVLDLFYDVVVPSSVLSACVLLCHLTVELGWSVSNYGNVLTPYLVTLYTVRYVIKFAYPGHFNFHSRPLYLYIGGTSLPLTVDGRRMAGGWGWNRRSPIADLFFFFLFLVGGARHWVPRPDDN